MNYWKILTRVGSIVLFLVLAVLFFVTPEAEVSQASTATSSASESSDTAYQNIK